MGFERFTSRVARAQSVEALASCLFDDGAELTGAVQLGLYSFERSGRIDIHARNVPIGVIDRYEKVLRAHDPVLEAVSRTHTPMQVSFAEVRRLVRRPGFPGELRDFAEDIASRVTSGHYAVAPIIVGGKLPGTLNFSRTNTVAFDARSLARMATISLHVSSRLAALHALRGGLDLAWEEQLTRRGCEVAELAARGLTTAEVGRALGISANTAKKHLRTIYEKLGVSSRAELAATLATAARIDRS